MCFLMRRGINENTHTLRADDHPTFINCSGTIIMLSHFKYLKRTANPSFYIYEMELRALV